MERSSNPGLRRVNLPRVSYRASQCKELRSFKSNSKTCKIITIQKKLNHKILNTLWLSHIFKWFYKSKIWPYFLPGLGNGHPFFSKELSVLFRSFKKNRTFFAFFSVLFKRTEQSLRYFPFFLKEQNDLCILFRFFKKNGMFFTFFSVLYKRTERSFWFHKSYKHGKSRKKRM